MQYFISFLEGIITFVSPCLLPMLPIYISYFAGGGEKSNKRVIKNALGFIIGFTLVFVMMGAMAGTIGRFLSIHQTAVNIVTGIIVIFFGLDFLGILKLGLFKGIRFKRSDTSGFFSSALFGIAFSVGWTPCVGAFLGSALMLAANRGSIAQGTGMLLAYSLGLAIPFFASAILTDKLKGTFSFVKRNYRTVNLISGILLVAVGILMATGMLGKFLALLS